MSIYFCFKTLKGRSDMVPAITAMSAKTTFSQPSPLEKNTCFALNCRSLKCFMCV